ncbi:M48 family metallopeptidase [Cupriavidus basilensis]
MQRLRAIARRILPQTARWNERAKQWKWEVNLINAKQVNAFCMPGGKIAFYTGLLDQLRLTDDEVAMVMGHEIAHALQEHARERAAKSEITNLGANVISQAVRLRQPGQYGAGHRAQLLTLRFSRSDETEADLVGMDIAARAGYDPRAAVSCGRKWARCPNPRRSQARSFFPPIPRAAPASPNSRSTCPRCCRSMLARSTPASASCRLTAPIWPTCGGAPMDSGDDDRQKPLKK